MATKINHTIAALINEFPEDQARIIESIILNERDFEKWPNEEQIWASILILCGRNIENLQSILTDAKRDWRDLVIAAGLAIDDWQQNILPKIQDKKIL